METISRISLNEDSHYIQWYIPILQQQFLQFSWIRINLFVPNAPFLYARGYEEFFVLFLFFSSRKPYIIRNVPETWRDGDGNVYLLRINPVNSLVRDFLSRLFFQFCSERKNIVFNAVCEMSDHLWKIARKWKRPMKKHKQKLLIKEIS